MSLAEFFKQKNFTSCGRIHMAPGIAPKLLSNAIESFKFSGDARNVLALIDNTMFGSGKDGCLICSDRILFREPFSDATEFAFAEIKQIQSKDSRVFLNGRDVFKFNMPDKRDLQLGFEVLGQWLSSQATASSAAPRQVPVAASTEAALSADQLGRLLDVVREAARDIVSDKVFVHPHIPVKKLQGALGAYGQGINADEVIVLVDDTLFGGAKEGVLITSRQIAMKMMMESPRQFSWEHVESLGIDKRKLFLNEREVGQLAMVGEGDLGDFIEAVDNCLLDLRSHGALSSTASPNTVVVRDEPVESSALVATVVEQVEAVPQSSEAVEHQALELELSTLAVDVKVKDSKAGDRLFGVIASVIEQNKSKIIPLLKEKTGDASLAALRDDANIEKLAVFLYAFLPSLVRLALKEEVFVQFMLANRNKVLDKILPPELGGEVLEAERVAEVPARRLSSFALVSDKSPETTERPSYFRQKLLDGQEHLELFPEYVRRASTAERRSEAFQQTVEQGHLNTLGVGILALALEMPQHVAQALDHDLTDEQVQALASDEATLETLGYAITSIAHMLRREAGYNEDQVLEFISPIMQMFIVPYVQLRVGEGKKTLRSVVNPLEQVVESELMKSFQINCRRLGMNLANQDIDSLTGNYTFSVYRAVKSQFTSEREAIPLSSKLDTFAKQGAVEFLEKMDTALEGLIIRYLERYS